MFKSSSCRKAELDNSLFIGRADVIHIRAARYSHSNPNYRVAKPEQALAGSPPAAIGVFDTDLPQCTGTGCLSVPKLSIHAAQKGWVFGQFSLVHFQSSTRDLGGTILTRSNFHIISDHFPWRD